MRIERTPARLTIDAASWWVSGIAAAVVAGALGFGIVALGQGHPDGWWLLFIALFAAGFLLAFTERCQLILDAATGEMIHRRRSFAGLTETRAPLGDVFRAELRTTHSDGGTSQRMEILVGAERIPFRTVQRGGDSPKRAADAVNDWLAANR